MSSFNKYYKDELIFLRELGQEFSRAYPELAPHLANPGSDPDVERLLEGFAFLTGRIRQKIDDEFPELTHALVGLLWPHYLRPVPSMSMVEFTPIPGAVRDRQTIPRGAELASAPVEGTPCRFRTAWEVDLYPFTVEEAGLRLLHDGRSALRLRCRVTAGGLLSQIDLKSLRLHLFGDPARLLYLWLSQHLAGIECRALISGKPADTFALPAGSLQGAGFSREEALLPYPHHVFEGYRLLQEYFLFPEKFLFITLQGLQPLTRVKGEGFEIDFIFTEPMPAACRVVREHIRLFCVPVVNLFTMESDPIRVRHDRIEYPIRPAGSDSRFFEVHAVDRGAGWQRGSAQEQSYPPFYSFRHYADSASKQTTYYQTRLKESVVGEGTEVYVSFVDPDQRSVVPPTDTVVFRLTCSNRNLAAQLRIDDIHVPTDSSPAFARFRNITRITPAIRPPIGEGLAWRLISHLALNYTSFCEVSTLREILSLYNFPAFQSRPTGEANQRRIEGIVRVEGSEAYRLFRGIPVRGRMMLIGLNEEHFSDDGDRFLFAALLNEFLSLHVPVNLFSALTVRGEKFGEEYRWSPRIGRQTIL